MIGVSYGKSGIFSMAIQLLFIQIIKKSVIPEVREVLPKVSEAMSVAISRSCYLYSYGSCVATQAISFVKDTLFSLTDRDYVLDY